MNRRDFLFLRHTPRGRTLELSCRALYMRTLSADAPTSHPKSDVLDHEPWMGEPPTDFERSAGGDWVRELEEQLREVDVLTLLDGEWLRSTPISKEIDPVLDAFRARGGRIELAKS